MSKSKQDFFEFHYKYPEVYEQLRQMALDLKERGHSNYGINGLIEVYRWHRAMNTEDKHGFKINNNYAPYYARLLMHYNPELDGFFRLRELKSA